MTEFRSSEVLLVSCWDPWFLSCPCQGRDPGTRYLTEVREVNVRLRQVCGSCRQLCGSKIWAPTDTPIPQSSKEKGGKQKKQKQTDSGGPHCFIAPSCGSQIYTGPARPPRRRTERPPPPAGTFFPRRTELFRVGPGGGALPPAVAAWRAGGCWPGSGRGCGRRRRRGGRCGR